MACGGCNQQYMGPVSSHALAKPGRGTSKGVIRKSDLTSSSVPNAEIKAPEEVSQESTSQKPVAGEAGPANNES